MLLTLLNLFECFQEYLGSQTPSNLLKYDANLYKAAKYEYILFRLDWKYTKLIKKRIIFNKLANLSIKDENNVVIRILGEKRWKIFLVTPFIVPRAEPWTDYWG